MTILGDRVDPGITCAVLVNGTRMADTAADLIAGTPTVLSDLSVTWGRTNTTEQPDIATARWRVADRDGAGGFLSDLAVGHRVDITATGRLWETGDRSILPDPGFEATPPGQVPLVVPGPGTAVTVTDEHAHTGQHSAELDVAGPGVPRVLSATFPPAPHPPADTDRGAWDHVPATVAAQPWDLAAWVRGPAGATVTLTPVTYTGPWAYTATPADESATITLTGGWQRAELTWYAPTSGRWVGLHLAVTDLLTWLDIPDDIAWQDLDPAVTWADYGRVWVDDLDLRPADAAGQRAVHVFTGRITDLEVSRTRGDHTQVDVTCADFMADLAQRVIGDDPWPEQPLGTRAHRILQLADLPERIVAEVDPGPAARMVTYRDVDAQAAGGLLQELAKSADAVCWAGTHHSTGPFLWIEDPSQHRGGLLILIRDPDTGLVVIRPTDKLDAFTELSASRLLRDPARWRQTVADLATLVDLVWLEQGIDPETGRPDTTERHVKIIAPDADLSEFGTRRVGVQTQLSRLLDAEDVAARIFGRLNAQEWRASNLTWDTSVSAVDTDGQMLILDLLDGTDRLGHPLTITDLPDWSPREVLPAYLEGGRYTFDRTTTGVMRWTLELGVSSATAQGRSITWAELPGAKTLTRTNRALNPRAVASGAAGWTALRGWGQGVNAAGVYSFVVTPTPPPTGVTTARRKTWTGPSTNPANSGFEVHADGTNRFPVTAGEVITVSAFMRHSSTTTKTFVMRVQTFDTLTAGTGTSLGTVTSTAVTAPGTAEGGSSATWHRVSLTMTVPAGAVGMQCFPDIAAVGNAGFVAGEILDATCLLVESGAVLGDWFAGSSDDSVWNGAVDASTSTQTTTVDDGTGWSWDEFDPDISWVDLTGVGP